MLRVLRSSRSSCIRRLCTEKIKTDIDIEKDLFVLKRRMGGFHSVGNYKSALEVAEELQDKVKSLMGEDNAMYASCLNNVALMQKYLGKIEESVEAYTQALHIYEDAVGKKHSSYAITLANLGASYKVYAETSKGMEKMQLLERAKEALEDAQGILKEVNGHESKPAITAAISLSSVYKIMGDDVKAENILQSSLETARTVHGDMSSLTATILNNIGILLKKSSDRQAQALIYYEEALKIRTYTLGNQHPDTIISMNNLAELYISMGREKEATKLQEQIIELVNAQMEEESEIDAVNAAISKRNSKNDNTEWKPY